MINGGGDSGGYDVDRWTSHREVQTPLSSPIPEV
jgi:hypothetical protein